MRYLVLVVALAALVALVGCNTLSNTLQHPTTRQPSAAELHAALERCRAEARAGWHTDVNLCFAKARREIEAGAR